MGCNARKTNNKYKYNNNNNNNNNVLLLLGAFQLATSRVCFSFDACPTEITYLHLQHIRPSELYTTADKLHETRHSIYCLGVRGGTYAVRLTSVLTHYGY